MSNEVPDHMKIKSTGKLCTGYLGKTGATHHSSTKSNMKCSHTLCLSVTPQFQSKFSQADPVGSSKSDRYVHTNTITALGIPSNIQAVALLANSREAAKRGAVCTIWIELWTKPGSSTMINAEAPHWPLFLLQESQIVLDRCRKALSGTDSWESEIQVWNTEQAQCSASKTDSTHSDIEWIGSSLAPKGSPEVPTQMEKSHPKWPDSRVLLCQTIRWHASSEHQGHHRDAWDQFFGEGYDYGHTTVYRVRKWISRMYFQEWLDTKKARGKDKNQLKPKREGQVPK
ncbi:hypothetical protein KEM48_012743 [Puccinia striiformis f. sp. tritici PST-130]|nr:hypothetical protein KEM48_012743 [Puccinia striiformis f. sp. tritici PST-130]